MLLTLIEIPSCVLKLLIWCTRALVLHVMQLRVIGIIAFL